MVFGDRVGEEEELITGSIGDVPGSPAVAFKPWSRGLEFPETGGV